VGSHSLAVWRDYLRFHVIDRYAEVLPQRFAQQSSQMRRVLEGDTLIRSSREQRALDATNNTLPDAVGHLYADRYFPPETKAKVQTIAANVIDAFAKRLEAVQWMAPATKTEALSKLRTLYFGVGYPETWPDMSGLWIDANDPIGNLQRASDWSYRNALANLEKLADRRAWVMAPQTVGAYSIPPQNAYNFAAALLQAPKFDATASDAANYGALGAIFGHEISHFVDRLGADYDAEGRMHHWWTDADETQFAAHAEPLVSQFSGYHPFPDIAINGKLTLSENVADLGGLAAAFDAYRHTLGSRVNDKDFVRQQDRLFFVAFARAWRVKIRDDAMRTQVSSNDHAPEPYRVLTVRNIDAWYDAFDVIPGQQLYLQPSARVRIW
jgi:putative endopeptidase